MSSEPKQVIIVRTHYVKPDGTVYKIRSGKQISQCAHASMAFLTQRIRKIISSNFQDNISWSNLIVSQAELEWIVGPFAKIVVGVDSEEELMEIHEKAIAAGLTVNLIEDSGRTEFAGVATKTAIAIGPDYPEKIDPITGHLKLL